jgi:phosphate/sulfate permease
VSSSKPPVEPIFPILPVFLRYNPLTKRKAPILALLLAATLFLAFSNGANDNFKGVATLYDSNTAHYPLALALATLTTLASSAASLFFATGLLKSFSGGHVVPDGLTTSSTFLLAVAAAGAATIFLATLLGIGLVNKSPHWKTISQITLAWLSTLPAGLALGAAAYTLLSHLH